MKIHHIALYANNLEKIKAFFETYFNATAIQQYHNQQTGLRTYMLSLDGETKLELMSRPEVLPHSELEMFRHGWIHISIAVGSKENVDSVTAQLKKDGYEVLSGPRTTGDGYYESCIQGPENIILEITI